MDFGRCPRSFCHGQPVLPVGLSDSTREFSVEVFCPQCHQTYHPRSSKHSNLDGAYFGTTFCHVFLLTHPELIVPRSPETYVPRIFGFRIHESSHYYKLRYFLTLSPISVFLTHRMHCRKPLPVQSKRSGKTSKSSSGANRNEPGSRPNSHSSGNNSQGKVLK